MGKRKKVLAGILIAAFTLSQTMVAMAEVKVGDELVVDGSFEGDLYAEDSPWTIDSTTWDAVNGATNGTFDAATGDENQVKTGSKGLNTWFASDGTGGTATMTQTIPQLPAGTYKLSLFAQGNITAKLAVAGQESDPLAMTGWGNWDELTKTITINEALTDATLTFTLEATPDGWGWVDDISMKCLTLTPKTDNGDGGNAANGNTESGNAANGNTESGNVVSTADVIITISTLYY